ncbi:MAG: zinc-ribbon domain-containing protein [Planctomycetes bacterium]|nr:zinc-ribbon domain-containing protein [Planctomycetota bacterium]
MKNGVLALTFVMLVAAFAATIPGCATSSETVEPDTLTQYVGVYPPPPRGLAPVRLGVPNFKIIGEGGSRSLEEFAGAQLGTMAYQTKRFDVIERDQLEQLLDEQGLEGIVRSDELARAGQVRGVDYLMYGKVTNLRVKAERASRGFGFGSVPLVGIGGFDYKKKDTKVVAECGVDLRMVDPTTGKMDAAHFGEFKRIDSVGAFGIEILGVGAEADAELEITEDDKGKLLRLALDEAVRKMLPDIDRALEERARANAASQPAPAAVEPAPAAAGGQPAPEQPAAAKAFCPNCGAKLAPGAAFCGSCGAKISS